MRTAVIGPAYPYKGGVAQHTNELAHQMWARGHDVELVSWYDQFPRRYQKGAPALDEPELVPFPSIHHSLSWRSPQSWLATGRDVRTWADLVVIAVYTPLQCPAYATVASMARAGGAQVIALCHNVVPHEPKASDRHLLRLLLHRVDGVVVHTPAEADQARRLTKAPVTVIPLAPPHPFDPPRQRPDPDRPVVRKVLFFGYARPYKGLDVLVRALGEGPPDVSLAVAGELWDGRDELERIAGEAGVAERVELYEGYVPAPAVPGLLASVDAMVLPYRSATGSWNASLAHLHGLPVVVTDVGTLAEQVQHGVDGLVCAPDDVGALAACLEQLYQPGVLPALRRGIRVPDPNQEWERYAATLEDTALGDAA